MQLKRIGTILSFAFVCFFSTNFRAYSLTITRAELSTSLSNDVVNIKNKIKDGERFEFDFHDFPEFAGLFPVGAARGFVEPKQTVTFATLLKGLFLNNTVANFPAQVGMQVIATLDVEATWPNPGGRTVQEINVFGSLDTSPNPIILTSAAVQAKQGINPFIGNLETIAATAGSIPVFNQKGPLVEVRPPEIEVFTDEIRLTTFLGVGADGTDFARANFLGSTLERARVLVPEPSSTLSLLVLSILFSVSALKRKPKLYKFTMKFKNLK